MRAVVPLSCLVLLLAAGHAPAQSASRSPFASWAADVASPARTAAAPWLGRELCDDGLGRRDRARPLHAALDSSGPLVGADEAHAAGTTGRGTLVAVIDSGVDFAHPAFLDAAGQPRIVWYLDLTLPSRGSPGPNDRGGALFDRDDLARALRDPAAPRPTPDLSGHGSRVASVAAGDEPPYRGVAPGAELVVVRADRLPGGRYDEADVADALAFAFEAADALDRPCVVNLSLGGQSGAHDGTSWLEQAIDAAVTAGPGGRAVVVAAGNDGEAAVHARLEPTDGTSGRVALLVPANGPLPGAPAAVALLDLWSSPGRSFALTVTLPDGTARSVSPGDSPLELALADAAALRLEPPGEADPDRRTEALLALVGGADGSVPAGRYLIDVRADAAVDAWLAVEARTSFLPFRLDGGVVAETTLSIPATAHGAITVGSLTSRSAWSNHLGTWVEMTTGPLGTPSAFNGRGPTADGRFKPDLVAPGEWVLGAQSAAADWPLAPGGVPATGADGRWSAARGTSLGAPHVAGAVALLFEREPGLHAEAVVQRLRAAAHGTGLWDPAGGFGRLDVPALLAPLPPSPATARVVLSLARPRLPLHGSRSTEVAVLRRTEDGPVSAAGCSLRWSAALQVTPRTEGASWLAHVDASRLAPGECAELVAVGGPDGPASRATLCVAAATVSGCGIAVPSPAAHGSLLGLACLLVMATILRIAPRRRWPFILASVVVHLLLLGSLAWLVPALRPLPPATLVAAGILAEVERPEPAPPPRTPTPVPDRAPQLPITPPAAPLRSPEATTAPAASPARAPRPSRAATAVAPAAAPGSPLPDLPVGDDTAAAIPAPTDLLAAPVDPAGAASTLPQPDGEPVAPARPTIDPCIDAADALRAVVDAHKHYPALARRRGTTGTTVVAFDLTPDGTLARLAVERSSGSSLLDAAALAAVREAAPFVVGGCSFTLPLQFRLQEAAVP